MPVKVYKRQVKGKIQIYIRKLQRSQSKKREFVFDGFSPAKVKNMFNYSTNSKTT